MITKDNQRRLLVEQLERKISLFSPLKSVSNPGAGWVNAIRTALGMSLKQLGKRLNITSQGVKKIEDRENDGSITIKSLQAAAAALDMQLVYGFVPKGASLEVMIERQARKVATKIVMRTSQTMLLEDQALAKEDVQRAITIKTEELLSETPRYLWD